MTFPTSTQTFYPRDKAAAKRGAELMKTSLNRGGNNAANPNPRVPTPSWVASKINDAKRAARESEAGKLKDKSATTSTKTKEHFVPRKKEKS